MQIVWASKGVYMGGRYFRFFVLFNFWFYFLFFVIFFSGNVFGDGPQPMQAKYRYKKYQKSNATEKAKYPKYQQLFISASIYEERGDLDTAMNFYRKSMDIKDDYIPAATNLAIILFQKEEYNQADKIFSHLYRKRNDSPVTHNNYALSLLMRNRVAKSIQVLKRAVKKFPRDYELHFNLGTAYYKKNQYNNAKLAYHRALRIFPKDYSSLNNLGCTLIYLREFKAAKVHIEQAIARKPQYSHGYYNLAYLYWQMKDSINAENAVAEALKINPNHKMALLLKKRILEQKTANKKKQPVLDPKETNK